MMDIRVERLARILVDYSIGVKEKETVLVSGSPLASPLIKEIYKKILQRGAYPRLRISLPEIQKIFFDHAGNDQLTHLSLIDMYEAENSDASIAIQSESNTRVLTNVEPQKQVSFNLTMKPLKDIILKKNRWALTLFPTGAYAQDAEMSLEELEDFVYSATFADRDDPISEWEKVSKNQQKIVDLLNTANMIHIIGKDTDIQMSVSGRKFINSDGHYNMPSGEVFTGPIENSVQGHIRFSFPASYQGKEISDIRLIFNNGKVTNASAAKNEQFLHRMLEIDQGASYVGELGIGNNWGITRFIKNILFDEKIGGTIHIALGSSYPETGGINKSALHWDMIKDLRQDGEMYIDGKLFQKNGRFIDLP